MEVGLHSSGCCIQAGGVAPPSNTRGILGRRALPARPDQSAGAAFAVGGGDAGLSTADLAGEGVALAALSLM